MRDREVLVPGMETPPKTMIAVVVPSNRPESLARWRVAWDRQLEELQASLYVVRDEPAMWEVIRGDLGDASWIIPVKTDCVRSYGYLKAWRDGATHIITMDDDCYPVGDLIAHVTALDTRVEPDGWVRTVPDVPTRGLPLTRPVGINHGLWEGVLDVSGAYQLAYGAPERYTLPVESILPVGRFAPLSGMNLAWRAELTPLLYFTLQGYDIHNPVREWGPHRFGDIWAGLFAKRICDHLGYAVRSGTPFVLHERASDARVNAAREVVAARETEWLWAAVRDVPLSASTPLAAYRELATGLAAATPRRGPYWASLTTAMLVWASLFDRRLTPVKGLPTHG